MTVGGKIRAAAAVVLLAASVAAYLILGPELTFDELRRSREELEVLVRENYAVAVAAYMGAFATTAFFVPGALVMTIASGLLFGTWAGAAFTLAGALAGASAAFELSRHLAGGLVREALGRVYGPFRKEVERHGHSYLIVLRVVPVLPFFAVNYLAGISGVRAFTFLWTTAVGMLPGAVIYAWFGSRLSEVDTLGELASPGTLGGFILIAVFAMLPVIKHHLGGYLRRRAS